MCVKTQLTYMPVLLATASSAVTHGVATVSSLLMGLLPSVCREQMADSPQILSVHGEHLRAIRKEKEQEEEKEQNGLPGCFEGFQT